MKIYSDGERASDTPFDGWLYFTEYSASEDGGLSLSTGANKAMGGEVSRLRGLGRLPVGGQRSAPQNGTNAGLGPRP